MTTGLSFTERRCFRRRGCGVCDAAVPPRWRRRGGRFLRGRRWPPRRRISGQVGGGGAPVPPRGSTCRRTTGWRWGLSRFPTGAGGGEAPSGVTDDRLLEGAQGADDELPSFFLVDGEPPSPTGPEELVLEAATVHDAVDEGATAHGRGPHLFAGADGGQDGGGQIDGTQSFGADASGSPSCAVATGVGALPHGVVSPPATTAFGGGIGFAPMFGTGDNTNIAHSVPLDSDSDSGLGGSDSAAIAANDVAASGGPEGVPSPPRPAGAHQ